MQKFSSLLSLSLSLSWCRRLRNRLAFGAFFFEEVKGPVGHDMIKDGNDGDQFFFFFFELNEISLKAQKGTIQVRMKLVYKKNTKLEKENKLRKL
jgi:hypothetical protein